MQPDCPFCLSNGLLKVPVLAETEAAYLAPALNFPGCHLIIPKAHIEMLDRLPDDWWTHFKTLLGKIEHQPKDYNLSLNYGAPSGQTLSHLHFWIVPRAEGEAATGKGLVTLVRLQNESAVTNGSSPTPQM